MNDEKGKIKKKKNVNNKEYETNKKTDSLDNLENMTTDVEEKTQVVAIKKKKKVLKPKIQFRFHIGYKIRLFFSLFFLITFVFLWVVFLFRSFEYKSEKYVNYKETSNLDYKVYLKENDFYEKPYIDKDMIYIASLINKINIDFNYSFVIDEPVNVDFSYDIIGKLVIADETGNKSYFEKEYVLKDSRSEGITNAKTYNLKDFVSIDYDYYNDLANNFKNLYGVDTTSNLVIFLRINKVNPFEKDIIKISDTSNMSISIPLSKKSVYIKMTYTDINSKKQILSESTVIIDNPIDIVIFSLSFVLSIISLVKFISLLSKLKTKKSIYDDYVNRKLLEYDRLIVETATCPEFSKYNIIKIKRFEELLDVRDNLKVPILHYTVVKHQKCYFYIKQNEDIYLLTIKAVDLEKN